MAVAEEEASGWDFRASRAVGCLDHFHAGLKVDFKNPVVVLHSLPPLLSPSGYNRTGDNVTR